MRSTTLPVLLAAVVVPVAILAPTGAAAVASPVSPMLGVTPPARIASTTPLPTVQVDGVVWAQATVGDTVIAVGSFSNARPAGAAAGTRETPRGNILAYDIRTGALVTSFAHTLNAQALTVTPSPDGSVVYVGGQFSQVDGQKRYRVAAFSMATGALLPYAPYFDATVQAIAVTPSKVYLGGSFSVANGHPRERLAATTTSGDLLAWAPRATGMVRGIIATPKFGRVYLAGSFSTLNGQPTHGVSAVTIATGASIDVPVSRQILASTKNSSGAGIYSLRTDGVRIYGASYHAAAPSGAGFEGTFAVDPPTGRLEWVNDCFGDSYDAVPVAGLLYVASHVHTCEAPGFFGQDGGDHFYGTAYGLAPGSGYNRPDRRGWDYSQFHTSSWAGWQPPFERGPSGQAVWSFTGNDSYVSAGGDFPGIGTVAQQGLARFAVANAPPSSPATP